MQRRIVPDITVEGRELLELPATASVYEAACAMRDWCVGAVLVTEAGRLAGIFTKRDMIDRVVASQREPKATPLAEVMTENPSTAGSRLVGIVSRRDFFGSEKARLETESKLWERL
jgi:CBS domain-containing protein